MKLPPFEGLSPIQKLCLLEPLLRSAGMSQFIALRRSRAQRLGMEDFHRVRKNKHLEGRLLLPF